MCKEERISFINMITQKTIPVKEQGIDGISELEGSDLVGEAGRSRSMFRTMNRLP